jgi:hypothetical protein
MQGNATKQITENEVIIMVCHDKAGKVHGLHISYSSVIKSVLLICRPIPIVARSCVMNMFLL